MVHLVNRQHKLISINTVQNCKCIFSYDFLNNVFFSLAYFIVRIQYIIHTTYQRCVNRLFKLSVRLLINNRLLVVNLGGSQRLRVEGFPGGSVVNNPPASAGDTGSIPGPGRSHMPRSN